MKNLTKYLTESVLIPVTCIAGALVYIVATQGYPSFEAVKYPYTLAIVVICIFSVIAFHEIRSLNETGDLFDDEVSASEDATLQPSVPGTKWNPLWVVLLTFLYAALFPILNIIAASFIYITLLRIALKKFSTLLFFLDFIGVVAVFILFGVILKIALPMGVLEEAIMAIFIR